MAARAGVVGILIAGLLTLGACSDGGDDAAPPTDASSTTLAPTSTSTTTTTTTTLVPGTVDLRDPFEPVV